MVNSPRSHHVVHCVSQRSGQAFSGQVIPMCLRNAVLSLELWTHGTCSEVSGRSHKCRVKTGWIWAHIGAVAALRSWLFRCLSASLNFPVFSKCFTVDTCYFFKGKSNQDKAKVFPMTGYWALSLCFDWTLPLDLHLMSSLPVMSQAMHFERLLSHLTQNCRWLINIRQRAMQNTSYDLWSLGSSLRPLFVSLCNYLQIWKNHFQSLR